MEIFRILKNLWRLAASLDVVDTGEGRALIPLRPLGLGSAKRPFASVNVDKDTVSVYAVKGGENYEKLTISYNSDNDVFEIRSRAGGTGVLRPIRFTALAGSDQLIIAADGTPEIPSLGVLRTDVAQSLSAEERTQYRENLGLDS